MNRDGTYNLLRSKISKEIFIDERLVPAIMTFFGEKKKMKINKKALPDNLLPYQTYDVRCYGRLLLVASSPTSQRLLSFDGAVSQEGGGVPRVSFQWPDILVVIFPVFVTS